MKSYILFLSIILIFKLNSSEIEVRDIFLNQETNLWNIKEGDIYFFRLQLNKNIEKLFIEMRMSNSKWGLEECDNITQIFVHNFENNYSDEEIIYYEEYKKISFNCYYDYVGFSQNKYILGTYKPGITVKTVNYIGIKLLTNFEDGLVHLNISEPNKKEKDKDKYLVYKIIIGICLTITIILFLISYCIKQWRKGNNSSNDSNNNNSSNEHNLIPEEK